MTSPVKLIGKERLRLKVYILTTCPKYWMILRWKANFSPAEKSGIKAPRSGINLPFSFRSRATEFAPKPLTSSSVHSTSAIRPGNEALFVRTVFDNIPQFWQFSTPAKSIQLCDCWCCYCCYNLRIQNFVKLTIYFKIVSNLQKIYNLHLNTLEFYSLLYRGF